MASPVTDRSNGKPRRKRRWLQFGLPTLLGLVTLLAIVLALIVNPAQRQHRSVAALRRLDGWVHYEERDLGHVPGLTWLPKQFGDDYFAGVDAVWLNDSQVGDAELAHLEGLTRLQWLRLDNTQLSDAGLAHLKGLSELQILWLNNTQVGDAGLVHLKGLTGLRALSLNNTRVSDAGLAHLKGLTALRGLGLSGTQVSDAGVEDLRAALPGCNIIGPEPSGDFPGTR